MVWTEDDPDLDRLFDPRAVAFVGASADPKKLSGRPHRYMEQLEYEGETYLVNPSRDEIDGRRCYDSLDVVPGPVDLAMVLVPAGVAPSVLEDCGRNDVPFALVIASGFSGAGDDGAGDENALLTAAREGGVRLVGPNSEGLVAMGPRLGASFSSILKRDDLSDSDVAVVRQSGAFGGALFQVLLDEGVGVGTWLSTGNERDLTTTEYLAHLIEDDATSVVVVHAESLDHGDRLPALGRRAAETGTDLVVINAGASERGRATAASHTGSVASEADRYEAALRAAGAARVHGVDDTVDMARALRTVPRDRRPTGEGGIGVLSVSGGAGVLIADAAERAGLPLATFTAETRERIADAIPPYVSAENPVDIIGAVIGEPDVFTDRVRTVAEDSGVGSVLLQFSNSDDETVEACKEDLLALPSALNCAVAAVFTGAQPAPETAKELADAGVLTFRDPVRAVETLATLTETHPRTVDREPAAVPGVTPDDDVDAVLDALAGADVDVVETVAVDDADDAVVAVESLGYPVVYKLDPTELHHKTEVDGVRVGLADAAAVRDAYRELAAEGPVVVQRQVDSVEVHVGVVDDPDVGPTLTVGPGREFVEVFEDRAYRRLPLDREAGLAALEELPLSTLLSGYRGAPAADREALADLLVAVSDCFLASDCGMLEPNPMVATPDGAVAIDVLVA